MHVAVLEESSLVSLGRGDDSREMLARDAIDVLETHKHDKVVQTMFTF